MEVKTDLNDLFDRYREYNWTKKAICKKWGISAQ